jgi:hypothetical protein
MTPLYVDQLWRLATREAGRRQRPILYVFAELVREEVRRQALEDASEVADRWARSLCDPTLAEVANEIRALR